MSGSFLDNLDFAEKAMEVQKGILCSDSFLIHKRPEIAGYFALEQDTKLQTEYFKNCFHFNIYYGYEAAGIPVGFYANEEGIHFNMSGKPGVENEALISWEDARFFVNSYMEDDVYLLPGEKAERIDTRHNHTVDNGKPQVAKLAAAMADKPVQRTSLREKLEAFKAKVSGTEKQEKHKEKGKEVTM